MHLSVLQGEDAQVGAQRNHFGRTYWYSKVKRLKWKLGSFCLEIVLILIQDRMHGLHGTYHMLGNQFGRTRWNY